MIPFYSSVIPPAKTNSSFASLSKVANELSINIFLVADHGAHTAHESFSGYYRGKAEACGKFRDPVLVCGIKIKPQGHLLRQKSRASWIRWERYSRYSRVWSETVQDAPPHRETSSCLISSVLIGKKTAVFQLSGRDGFC